MVSIFKINYNQSQNLIMHFPSLGFASVAVINHHKPEDLREQISHPEDSMPEMASCLATLPLRALLDGEHLAWSCIAPISALPFPYLLLCVTSCFLRWHLGQNLTYPGQPHLQIFNSGTVLETRSASQGFWYRSMFWRQLFYPGWKAYLVHIRMKSPLLHGSFSVSGGPIY